MSRSDKNKNKKNKLVAQTVAAAAITSLVASIAAIGVAPSSVIAQQFQEEDHRCPVGFTLNHGTCETEPVITCPDPLEVSENRCIMYDHEDKTPPGA
jgi:hypothetical protein